MFLAESLGWMGINTPMNWRLEGSEPIEYVEFVLVLIIMLAGFVSAALIISGAYTLITSSGDPENIAKGQKTITNAIIGLVIAALAFLIVNFAMDFVGDNGSSFGGGGENGGGENGGGTAQIKCADGFTQHSIGTKICDDSGATLLECVESTANPGEGTWIPIGSCPRD